MSSAPVPTAEQAAAIARRDGDLLLAAGAGSGKTTVFAERFVASVLEDDLAVGTILAITFTDKAAGQLVERISAAFAARGYEREAREAEAAWIDTIHGACARMLRAHPLAAGIDPRFGVLDEVAASRLESEAFESALDEDAVPLLAAYGRWRLKAAVLGAHSELRARGLPARLPDPGVRTSPEQAAPALDAAARALGATGPNEKVAAVLDACRDRLAAGFDPVPDPDAFEALRLSGRNGGEACESYRAALEAVEQACLDAHALAAWAPLDRLLARHAERYAAAKRERSALDFADLELLARDLLRDHPRLRDAYARRFVRIMVDEFQDTNPLQMEILDLLATGNLFTVGDEFQSIYGFRGADLENFRRRRDRLEAKGAVAALTVNFRSRPEILDVIGRAFVPVLGERFAAPRAGRDVPDAGLAGPRVELLLTDTSKPEEDEPKWTDVVAHPHETIPEQAWRIAEARLLAGRLRELVDAGTPHGDVVVLLRATGALSAFELALTERGLPSYVIGGRGYWGQREVQDLVAWLSVLVNPREEERLYEVLASPLVGVSADALVATAAAGREGRRGAWAALGDPDAEPLALLGDIDRERLAAFRARAAEERDRARRLGAEPLLEAALAHSGYDVLLGRRPGGARRLANVRKLLRLARDHEQLAGPDLRGFLDLVAERAGEEAAESRDGEAPIEGEQLDAIRLMTIHRAKGLEFPVVCVADTGRLRPHGDDQLVRLGRDGRVALKVAVPGAGKARAALDHQSLLADARAASAREEERLFYVACTRAEERLLVSGSVSFGRWPSVDSATCPPVAWLAPALVPAIRDHAADGGEAGEDGGVAWRISRPAAAGPGLRPPPPAADVVPPPPADGAPSATAPVTPGAGALPVDHVSYSSLEDHRRCGYRFYLERVLRLPAKEDPAPRGGAPAPEGLAPTTRGSIVHLLLERLDVRHPAAPGPLELDGAAAEVGAAELSDVDRTDVLGLVAAFARSALCERLAGATRLAHEEAFSFALGDLLVTGFLDVLAWEGDRALIVDYKTNRLHGREPAALVESDYAVQRLVYALAALRAGAASVDVAFAFLERADEPVVATFTAQDAPTLTAALAARAEQVRAGVWTVSARPDAELCHGCPGRGSLCSWPLEATRAEPAGEAGE